MIARSWDGLTPAAKASEYAEYLRRTGVPELAGTATWASTSSVGRMAAGRASG
jgi:hypothetical protein